MSSQVAPAGTKYRKEDKLSDNPENVRNPWLVDPNSPEMKRWDLCSICLLLFVMLVTPYEVAFLETSLNVLFVINRIVDLFFISDMVLQFFLMYRDEEKGVLIKDQNQIIAEYMKCWLWIDIISVLPFDMISLLMKSDELSKAKVRCRTSLAPPDFGGSLSISHCRALFAPCSNVASALRRCALCVYCGLPSCCASFARGECLTDGRAPSQ